VKKFTDISAAVLPKKEDSRPVISDKITSGRMHQVSRIQREIESQNNKGWAQLLADGVHLHGSKTPWCSLEKWELLKSFNEDRR
jgi:hypothetical protein